MFGHPPRQLGITNPQAALVPELAKWLTKRQLITKLLHQLLLRAQQRMKHQADKNRSERSFEVGDKVYFKLQPHVRSSVAFGSNHKLSYRFYGPFEITAKVGSVAYRLKLPESAMIHPVVHVSQLKKHVFPGTEVLQDLSSVVTNPDAPVLPVQVLEV